MNRVEINENRCKSCALCVSACPKKIIAISTDKMNSSGYRPAAIENTENCIGCTFCATVCPDCAITVYKED